MDCPPISDELCFAISRGKRLVARIYLTFVAFWMTSLVVDVIVNPGQLSAFASVIFATVFAIVGVVTLFWARRRLIKATVRATPVGLLIDNGMRKYSVQWSEITAFESSWRAGQMAVRRIRGRPISMAAITPGWFRDFEPQRKGCTSSKRTGNGRLTDKHARHDDTDDNIQILGGIEVR
jgi:hypothetical protein